MNDDGMREPFPAPATTDGSTDPAADGARARLSRRRFLVTGTASGVAATTATLGAARAQESTPAAGADTPGEAVTQVATVSGEQAGHLMEAAPSADQGGFTFFVPFQAAIIQAAAARLIPSDDLGPGATEAGVVYFIDRQLTEHGSFHAFRGPRYDLGPFLPGEPTQGDQSALPMRDRFRLGIQGMEGYAQQLYGQGFAELAPEEQDRILNDMENGVPETFDGASIAAFPVTAAPAGGEAIEAAAQVGVGAEAFFDLLLSYTFAGFFADPVQGGNRDMVGWKLIGFPGAHVGYPDQILNYGQSFDGEYISLAQYQQQIAGGD